MNGIGKKYAFLWLSNKRDKYMQRNTFVIFMLLLFNLFSLRYFMINDYIKW